MHKLSERMLMNVSLIPKGFCVADIGCDHGFVSIYLIENKLAKHVIAMDVAKGPLDRAKEHIMNAGLTDSIETRLSDGVTGLELLGDKLEAEVLLMAGIGGHLAVKLVKDNISKCRGASYIILQPQSDLDFVRNSMYELGFTIDMEDMVFEDGKYYTSMRFINCSFKEQLSEAQAMYGPVLLANKNKVLLDYLYYKKDRYEDIKSKLHVAAAEKNSERIAELKHDLEIIDKCLEIFG